MIAAVLIATLCPLIAGQPADDCDTVEIRAQSCPHAAVWLAAWVPHGWSVVAVECREERHAAR
jgi:hypothetical protein